MQIVRNEQRQSKTNGKDCVVHEYHTDSQELDMAVARIWGREPEAGWAENTVCNEVAYVILGDGTITVGDNPPERISSGDVIHIFPGERFFWEGDLKLAIACSPRWFARQYVHHETADAV